MKDYPIPRKFSRNSQLLLNLSIFLVITNFPLSSSKLSSPVHASRGIPKVGDALPRLLKIFDHPQPNDGYDSLRTFGNDLTEGMTRKYSLYNTSIALTSALFSFELPSSTSTEADTVNLANQVIQGMFGFLLSVLIFALPVLLTGQRFNPNARSNQDNDDGIIATILKTEPLAKLIRNNVHKQIGLEPEKCLQKTICEAHRSPKNKEYGMLALPFQIFYPPPSKNADRSRSTSYQDAAYDGKYTKTRCSKKYNCYFDVLDVGRYLIDWYQYHNPSGGALN